MLSINSSYLSAMTAHRYFTYNNNMAAKAMLRLSTGLRINSAADDPAGLSISEKMRAQIRGLGQAARNAQDAISMLQTAEGAAGSIQDILQRAKELATQAANDTLTPDDRKALNTELQQLLKEIGATAENTEFNTKKLLNHDSDSSSTIHVQVGPNSGNEMELPTFSLTPDSLGVNGMDILTRENAAKAITIFGRAIDRVSEVRSNYGASINRLEHTIRNLENSQENLMAAESRIRDADMAKEMMNYTKYSMLAQVAQLMMAQANQQAKGLLQLLRQSLGQEK
jgi:flagellin